MGYETKLIVGSVGHSSDQVAEGALVIEDDQAYKPMLKDEEGNFVYTGKKETYFSIYATIDLCNCGRLSAVHKIDRVNTDQNNDYYFFYGCDKVYEDPYGDRMKPVKIEDVITAIKKDIEQNGEPLYRRFKWAIGLLESMKDDKDIKVLVMGH